VVRLLRVFTKDALIVGLWSLINMASLQFYNATKFTEKGSERIRIILEEAKNTLVDEGFSRLSFRGVAKRRG
jgi:hypothetical protein